MAGDLIVEVESGIAWLTFNRPEARNAISPAMLEALQAFLLGAETDAAIRCIVLRGAGGHFMSGGDLRSFAALAELPPETRRQHFEARVARNTQVLEIIQRLPQPVIASVQGTAAGAGLGFAIACDLVVAARSASFVLSNCRVGAVPDAGTSWQLPRAVGAKRAMAMALLSERVDAATALAQGLVSHVVDDEQLETLTRDLALRVARGPRVALAQAKALIHRSGGSTLAEQLAAEARAMGIVAATQDFIEGPRAFLEKREPRFRGE